MPRDDFDVLIESLGRFSVDTIGSDRVASLVSRGSADTGEAEVEIGLVDDSWESRERAIDAMLDVREMFIDELALSFSFVDADDPRQSERPSETRYVAHAS